MKNYYLLLCNMKKMLFVFVVALSISLSGVVAGESSSAPMMVSFKGAIITKACIPTLALGGSGPREVVLDNYNPSGTDSIGAFTGFGEGKTFIVNLKPSNECKVPGNIKFSGDTITDPFSNSPKFILQNSGERAENVGVLVRIKKPRNQGPGAAWRQIDVTQKYAVAVYSLANLELSDTLSFRARYFKTNLNPLKGGLVNTSITLTYLYD